MCKNDSHSALRLNEDMTWRCNQCGRVWGHHETPINVLEI